MEKEHESSSLQKSSARYKAEAYCCTTEHCIAEVQAKLPGWGADEQEAAAIIAHLLKERYIDETRYATAFVRDKYRFNQWGRIKIQQALRMKHIPAIDIADALAAIDEEEYLDNLRQLIAQKRRSVKAASDYERNAKLIRFAVGRGYEMGEILKCVKAPEFDD
jgi:regulatory protein